jgi:alpha-L-arabinofuranosidase
VKRTFVRTALSALAPTLLAAASSWGAQPQAPIAAAVVIRADRPGAAIHRNVYGHFAEHLGRGVYEGIWVGEDSPIPNTGGVRDDVFAALQRLRVPVIRWPGGCFADEYAWRDGIGPRVQRPVRINTTWGGVEEPNAFGTHEFLDFAERLGADVYLAGNVGSGSPRELAQWVEYITSESTSTLAELRRANGREQPWRLPYLGVGNETWGCGGNMRPEYYADLYRRFSTFVKTPADNRAQRVASGASADDYRWTEVLLSRAAPHMDAYTLHYYTLPGDWDSKGAATGFDERAWAVTLAKALRIDQYIAGHSAIMDRYDPEKRIGLFVDEWGTWYDPEPGSTPGFLYQQNTLRDALVAALTFEVFHRHAERVRMANLAQMVNVLQAVILTDRERMVLTPTYHVLEMYVPFQGAKYLPAEVETPDYRHADAAVPAVTAAAARDAQGTIQLALVNADPHRRATVTARLAGAAARIAEGRVLTAGAMDAHNTFDRRNAVAPVPFEAEREGERLRFDLPPKSVAVVALRE